MRLTFHGGAGSVTGANYLLESGDHRVLIDCGLHQGGHYAERENFERFPYDAKRIEAVCVTHAHIDHIGLLPKLARDGFRGTIFSTPPTKDFAELLLLDSEHILTKEAEREGRPPLYVASDIMATMNRWQGVPYYKEFKTGPFRVLFLNAGHILGSSIVQVTDIASNTRIVFSGDLGNSPAPIIMPTDPLPDTEYCVIESTYGNRIHEDTLGRREKLEDVIEDIVRSGGTLLIPAFAMERTQDLLYHLNYLVEEKRVPRIPIFIDSPLAIKLTAVYQKYRSYFNAEASKLIREGDDILNFPGLHVALTTEESKAINSVPSPKVVIAGSGMSHGGRILHHERRYLPDPQSMILFVGYQGKGSLGRAILDGARSIHLFGEEVPVRAEKRILSGYSAHADQPHLLAWLRPRRLNLRQVFVVQGEEEASGALASKIRDELAVRATAPRKGMSVEL